MSKKKRNHQNVQETEGTPLYDDALSYGVGSDSWGSDSDSFLKISQQQSAVVRDFRQLESVFTPEQLALYDNGQFSELHFRLLTETKRDPLNVNLIVGIAVCNLAMGEPVKAAEFFAKVASINDAYRPSVLLHDMIADPDDLLDMAEEMGHCGLIDASTDLCTSIVESRRFPDNIRRQAMKMRDSIKQDYFAARERILVSNNQQSGEMSAITLPGFITFILLPLLLLLVIGSISVYNIQLSSGKENLALSMCYFEKIKAGENRPELFRFVQDNLDRAVEDIQSAEKYCPLGRDVYFYDLQAHKFARDFMLHCIKGTTKQSDIMRFNAVKEEYDKAQQMYDNLHYSSEKDAKLQAEWTAFLEEIKSSKM